MNRPTRREFLADVGQGMLVASVGATLASDLGIGRAMADPTSKALDFGKFEPLVALMQQTPAEKLLPVVVEKLKGGADLRTCVAAAALANARTFGGQDYIGYHSFMALAPSYGMAQQLPENQRALPVLKVLYRNTARMQAQGGRSHEALESIEAMELPEGAHGGELLRQATRDGDMSRAERTMAALTQEPVGEAFNHLQFAVQDEVNVHRVVLAWRAWMALDFTGQQYAQSLLRQSVRFCVDAEQSMKRRGQPASPIRTLLPKLIDQYKLLARSPGDRRADDQWIDTMAKLVANSAQDKAADAVAAALADGIAPDDVAQAICLAANELTLRDPGRPEKWSSDEKPPGSVHGDSVGVHASDAANAWRHIARVSNPRNVVASLIVGAYHTAGQYGRLNKEAFPSADVLAKIKTDEPAELLKQLDGAIREKDQMRAMALMQRYGGLGHAARPAFDLLLRYSISEDGALHAEKYYQTVSEEFASTRPAFRWRQLVALSRVVASEYGRPAHGYAQACELLNV